MTTDATQKKKFKFITPLAKALFVYIEKPDQGFSKEKPDPRYKITLEWDKADVEALNSIQEKLDEFAAQEGIKDFLSPFRFKAENKVWLTAKSKFPPIVYNNDVQEVSPGELKFGDFVQCELVLGKHYEDVKGTRATKSGEPSWMNASVKSREPGIHAWILNVQICKKGASLNTQPGFTKYEEVKSSISDGDEIPF